MQKIIQQTLFFLFFVLTLICSSFSNAKGTTPTQSKETETELLHRATAAYIYGYSLVMLDMMRQVMTNTVTAGESRAPMGQFNNLREFPTPTFKAVSAPNVDMLYSFAWLNLDAQPYILHLPDTNNRYYVMPVISGWMNVFYSFGKRTTGTKAQDFVIVGPQWHGKLPEGLTVVRSPTDLVWLKGRTYSTGTPEDLKIVHAIQDSYQLTPLSHHKKPYTPPKGKFNPAIDMKTSVLSQVDALDGATFFQRLAQLMKDNPPAKADAPMIENLAKLGIIPGQSFNIKKVDPSIAKAMANCVVGAQQLIKNHFPNSGVSKRGWIYMSVIGDYGTDYLQRALMARLQPGASIPADLVYPVTVVDSSSERLNGGNNYKLHFVPREMPPVNGFWSLTLYDDKYAFVPNPINRYSVSQRDSFIVNRNGSIDIYIQNDNPGEDRVANWLPSPKGDFILMFRLYWPKDAVLNGTWIPPTLKRIIRI